MGITIVGTIGSSYCTKMRNALYLLCLSLFFLVFLVAGAGASAGAAMLIVVLAFILTNALTLVPFYCCL